MSDGPARLIVKLGPNPNKEYLLTQPEITIGRNPGNTIVIPIPEISRRHARIRRIGENFQIEDWGSTNGTFVAGQRIMNSIVLKNEDEIQLGDSVILIFLNEPETGIIAPSVTTSKQDAEATLVDSSPIKPVARYEEPPAEEHGNMVQDVEEDEFILLEQEDNTSRNRLRLLGCGCLFILIPLFCMALLIFLDFYDQGRLLYCGPIRPIFEIILGPLGFSPICP